MMQFKLVTRRPDGEVYEIRRCKTLKGAKRAKERLNLKYGAHLSGVWYDENGTAHLILR